MPYLRHTTERLLLDDDPRALGEVIRWIAGVLAAPRFWVLRSDWADLQQEVLARVIESLRQERFDPARDFRFYVQGIARYTALQAMSRSHRHESRPLAGDEPSPTAGNPEQRAIGRQLVRRVLEQISEECRDLIRLYFLEDRSYDEIAAMHDLPRGTVKSRLFRCLQGAHEALHRRVPRKAGNVSREN